MRGQGSIAAPASLFVYMTHICTPIIIVQKRAAHFCMSVRMMPKGRSGRYSNTIKAPGPQSPT